MFIKLNKEESRLVNWVKRATSKDAARPVLNGLHINGALVASDGFRLHAIQSTSVPAMNDALEENSIVELPTIRRGENVVEPQMIDGTFPDYGQIVSCDEPTVAFGVSPALLIDALRDMDKDDPVRITVRTENNPIEVHGMIDGVPTYALIMPMHLGETSNSLSWKPSSTRSNE